MEVNKRIMLTSDEFYEAVEEYLAKRDVTFNVDEIKIKSDVDDEGDLYVVELEVIAR